MAHCQYLKWHASVVTKSFWVHEYFCLVSVVDVPKAGRHLLQ